MASQNLQCEAQSENQLRQTKPRPASKPAKPASGDSEARTSSPERRSRRLRPGGLHGAGSSAGRPAPYTVTAAGSGPGSGLDPDQVRLPSESCLRRGKGQFVRSFVTFHTQAHQFVTFHTQAHRFVTFHTHSSATTPTVGTAGGASESIIRSSESIIGLPSRNGPGRASPAWAPGRPPA